MDPGEAARSAPNGAHVPDPPAVHPVPLLKHKPSGDHLLHFLHMLQSGMSGILFPLTKHCLQHCFLVNLGMLCDDKPSLAWEDVLGHLLLYS